LMPRQDAFFPAFERHAAVMVKAAVALREMVAGGDQLKPCFQEILDLEHEADGLLAKWFWACKRRSLRRSTGRTFRA
jgi:uncharacterized protein Yka (UPF0111/DUF47 family)